MLGFGLTLLGGCVATDKEGHPEKLFYFCHSVPYPALYLSEGSNRSVGLANAENMSARAHRGYFLAENLQKTGQRASNIQWGLTGVADGTRYNDAFISFCAKAQTQDTGYATNFNITRAGLTVMNGQQPSLYVSSRGLYSPRFEMRLQDGVLRITDFFDGVETKTEVEFPDIRPYREQTRVCTFGGDIGCTYDFVVGSYINDGLETKCLSLPMCTLPQAFPAGHAIFSFHSKTLMEI